MWARKQLEQNGIFVAKLWGCRSRAEVKGLKTENTLGLDVPIWPIAHISHRVSSRGRRGAVSSGVFDSRGAEAYLTVR